MKYTHVRHRERKVAIVASGSSLTGVDLSRLDGVPVIAVNRAVLHCPADYWVTIDPDRKNYALMSHPAPGVRYYCGVPETYGVGGSRDHHVPLLPHVRYLRRVTEPGLATCRSTLHSGNSGYAALGLAYHLGARWIALLGIDGTQDRYFYPPTGSPQLWPRMSLAHMPDLFRSAVGQLLGSGIMVLNGSPSSRVKCFPRCTPEEAIEWIRAA